MHESEIMEGVRLLCEKREKAWLDAMYRDLETYLKTTPVVKPKLHHRCPAIVLEHGCPCDGRWIEED